MTTKHVLREARVQLKRYRRRLSDEIRIDIEADIDRLAAARKARDKQQARSVAKALLKKIRTHTPKTAWHHTIETVESFAVAIIVALAIRHFIIEPFKIPTGSMEPTLHGSTDESVPHIGDFIMVNKFAYGPKIPFTNTRLWTVKPKRWDIIVFSTRGIDAPDGRPAASDPPRNFVKRIVGLPGDTIELRWEDQDKSPRTPRNERVCTLYINGEKADLPDDLRQRLTTESGRVSPYLTAPPKDPDASEYSDHQYVKSRYRVDVFGIHLFPYKPNIGDVVVIGPWQLGQDGVPFTVPEGHYFVMGDNSPYSADSRAWGFVPFGNIKGKVLCVWYPFYRIRGVN
jgi:signal peptidase I